MLVVGADVEVRIFKSRYSFTRLGRERIRKTDTQLKVHLRSCRITKYTGWIIIARDEDQRSQLKKVLKLLGSKLYIHHSSIVKLMLHVWQ